MLLSGKKLHPSNKFSEHWISDCIYLGEGMGKEGVKSILEDNVGGPGWNTGHDGTGLYSTEFMHYNVGVAGREITLAIAPVIGKTAVLMREGYEKACADILGDSTTIPSIGNLNPIHSQSRSTLNDTAAPAKAFSKALRDDLLAEAIKVH